MRTNIVLDDELIAQVMGVTRIKTRREAVDFALRELLARHHSQQLKTLRGQGLIDPDYDVKQMRHLAGEKARKRESR